MWVVQPDGVAVFVCGEWAVRGFAVLFVRQALWEIGICF